MYRVLSPVTRRGSFTVHKPVSSHSLSPSSHPIKEGHWPHFTEYSSSAQGIVVTSQNHVSSTCEARDSFWGFELRPLTPAYMLVQSHTSYLHMEPQSRGSSQRTPHPWERGWRGRGAAWLHSPQERGSRPHAPFQDTGALYRIIGFCFDVCFVWY